MSLAFSLTCDERPRRARARGAASVFLLVASVWSFVLLDRGGWDRDLAPWLIVLGMLGLAGTVVASLRLGGVKPVRGSAGCGVLHVDARGRTFWIPEAASPVPGVQPSGPDFTGSSHRGLSLTRNSEAIEVAVARWQRGEARAWIRLVPLAADATCPVDLTLVARELNVRDWAAVCRWLMWLERRASPQ